MSRFSEGLERALDRMVRREPSVMYRFGDGELALARGESVGTNTQAFRTDRWSAPAQMTLLGTVLRTILNTPEAWAHYGIPCPCCNPRGHEELAEWLAPFGRPRPNLFPANLFVNANYPRFLDALPKLWRSSPVAIVANERAEWPPGRDLRVEDSNWLRVPDDCVSVYETKEAEISQNAREFAQQLPARTLVLSAAGPLSEALLFLMHESRPDLTYVDVGSALDESLYGRKTRPFMTAGTEYANRECAIPDAVTTKRHPSDPSDLTVSRYILPTDPRLDAVAGLKLPPQWWSRPYEYAWALAQVPDGARFRVLDAACGIPHPLKFALAEMGCWTDACDQDPQILQPEAILKAVQDDFGPEVDSVRRALPFLRLRNANVRALPYLSDTFDRVFCISLFEHMPRSEQAGVLRNFRDVLTDTGRIVLTADVPGLDPEQLPALLRQTGLRFVGPVDLREPPNALWSDYYGPRLRCFRALLGRA